MDPNSEITKRLWPTGIPGSSFQLAHDGPVSGIHHRCAGHHGAGNRCEHGGLRPGERCGPQSAAVSRVRPDRPGHGQQPGALLAILLHHAPELHGLEGAEPIPGLAGRVPDGQRHRHGWGASRERPEASRQRPGNDPEPPESVTDHFGSIPRASRRLPESSKIVPKASRTNFLQMLARF